MRIGLDFRFLSVGRQYVVRGIPRFTQEQLQAVLAMDRDNTYLLLCDPGDDAGAIRPEIRAAPNVRVVFAPDAAPAAFGARDDTRTLLARYSAYQRWVEGLRLDLYHATCHFWVSRLTMPGFDVCPYVVTAYDLIPLIYPALFQGEPVDAYQRGLLFLEQAARIAAISQATAGALVEHLGLPAERIDLTLPAISPCFRPIPQAVTRSILASLDHPARRSARRRVQIPPHYILSVTDLHFTKNLYMLLAAYADLPAETRARFPLVLAGDLGKGNVPVVRHHATLLGIEPDLTLTGRVSDHELMALYNGATLMVHPSHHEGFGLTVAEAMRCGTPVITTTRSALPEVAGGAAVLVDSEDRAAFTEAIDMVIRDGDLRNDLRIRGPVQAARFSTTALGQSTLDWYRNAVATPQPVPASVTRVAVWSPITPQPSDAATYADDVLAGLAAEPGLQLDVFVDDGVMPPLDLLRVARVHHWSDFDRSARQSAYDAVIYEHGASPLHQYMQQAMRRHPGVVVFHDLQRDGLVPVVDGAARCVALTPEAASEAHRLYAKADARIIPVGVRDPCEDGAGFDRVMARAYLALDRAAFVVVATGPVAAASRLDSVVDAVANLRQSGVNALLAIAGWTEEAAYASALRSRAELLGIRSHLRLTHPVPRREFDAYLAAADAVVALGQHSPLRTSAAVLRALAAGRCVVVSDGATSIPESVCIRVAAPPNERTDLTAVLSRLAEAPEQRQALERRARAHYDATGRLDRMVDGYLAIVRAESGRDGSQTAATRGATLPPLVARPRPRPGALPYSKACELEDFADPQLREVLREVCPHKRAAFGSGYPRGSEHREDWEAAMAVRTLSDHGALRGDARVLGVAPGIPDVVLYLTRHAGEVVAVDTRAQPVAQRFSAHLDGRRTAAAAAPFAIRGDRLTVRRHDAACLDHPDAHFDGIVGRFDHGHPPAGVLRELRRVLKPGGVLSLVMDLRLAADPWSEAGPPEAPPPSPAEVEQLIAEARGLEVIDVPRLVVSHWTLSTARSVAAATAALRARRAAQTEGGEAPDWALWDMPHIVLARGGSRYTSAHLALRRPSLGG